MSKVSIAAIALLAGLSVSFNASTAHAMPKDTCGDFLKLYQYYHSLADYYFTLGQIWASAGLYGPAEWAFSESRAYSHVADGQFKTMQIGGCE